MTRDPVAALLDPHSVAVVGASNDPLKRGNQVIRLLQQDDFPHAIHPVNPRETEILGLPVAPSLEAIDDEIDLALITTPAERVPDVLRSCAKKGVPAAVVVAVGFGEAGERGRELEEEVSRIAQEAGIKLVGPNTNGLFNLPAHLNLVGIRDVPKGHVALLCQSGNVGLGIFTDASHGTAVGFNVYVGIGNEAGVRYHELVEYLHDDPGTEAVLMYVEGFRDGRSFLAAASRLVRDKPLVLYKAGRSEAARRSALSHTGAIAGSPRLVFSLLRQAGVIVVERADELVPVCDALRLQRSMPGKRVAVLADGGGHATIAVDALVHYGLEVAELSDATRQRLAELLPPAASTTNPVDIAGAADRDPERFVPCLEALFDDPGVDGVLCVGLFGGYGIRFSLELLEAEVRAARRLAEVAAGSTKPVLVQSAFFHSRPAPHDVLRQGGVPVRSSIEISARAMHALWRRGRVLATAEGRSDFAPAPERDLDAPRRALPEPEGRDRAASRGLPVGPWRLVRTPDEAAAARRELGRAVALKVVSPDIVHKSRVGGVLLGLHDEEEARAGFETLVGRVRSAQPDADITGVLVTPMAPDGVELIVGATADPSFGPIITVGAGGVAVEAIHDVAFRATPVTRAECEEMLAELRIAPLLEDFRSTGPVDREAIIHLVLAVSELMHADEEIVELDLNPVIAHRDGIELVDVRVVVSESAGPHGTRRGRAPGEVVPADTDGRTDPDRPTLERR